MDTGDSHATKCTLQKLALPLDKSLQNSCFKVSQCLLREKLFPPWPHGLGPGGLPKTLNIFQNRDIDIWTRKYFFSVHMVATALKKDINIPALTT